ncbi:MAG: hypothetical protein JNK84_17785 [Phreatobacter sp.]|uniref:hypothetical protein n=1 Tax=Phreatobacter sp. TaxID=1966341 RepID=UPI001A48F104|nr:hypothetical protein [Phreatobacter sp.]MBL8570925.1 hypothetical protein [Phreatobacter sp.]
MTNFFEKLARGVEAATKAMGSDLVAETHPFDLTHSVVFPVAKLMKRRTGGEPIVVIELSDGKTTMTLAEFDRFVTELDAFRKLIPTAGNAPKIEGA